MFEQFSPRVAKVVKLAQQIARDYGMEYVGTEHVLLAIRREGTGVGAKVLVKAGITEPALKSEVDRLVHTSLEDTWVFGRLPGTPHFKNIVAVAIEQSRELDSKDVCTEHLLLAMLRESGSVAREALHTLGLTYDRAVQDVLELTGQKD